MGSAAALSAAGSVLARKYDLALSSHSVLQSYTIKTDHKTSKGAFVREPRIIVLDIGKTQAKLSLWETG